MDFCPTCLTRLSMMSDYSEKMYGINCFCFLLIRRDTSLQKYPDKTGFNSSSCLKNSKSLSSNWNLFSSSSSSLSSFSVLRVVIVVCMVSYSIKLDSTMTSSFLSCSSASGSLVDAFSSSVGSPSFLSCSSASGS